MAGCRVRATVVFGDVMKKPVLFFLVTLVFLPLFWKEAFGWSVRSIYDKFIERQDNTYSGYDFPPVKEWFGEFRLKRFNDHVKKGECGIAIVVMESGFKRRYPSAPDPAAGGDASNSFSMGVVPKHYPELFFCFALETMNLYQTEIDRRGLATLRLPQDRDRNFDVQGALLHHRFAVGRIVLLSIRDYAPAQLKLAQLSETGKVIRLTPRYLYYCLIRARMNGLASPELDRLLLRAKSALGEKQQQRIERRAKQGAWPRAEPLVVDGQRASWRKWVGIILNTLGLTED